MRWHNILNNMVILCSMVLNGADLQSQPKPLTLTPLPSNLSFEHPDIAQSHALVMNHFDRIMLPSPFMLLWSSSTDPKQLSQRRQRFSDTIKTSLTCRKSLGWFNCKIDTFNTLILKNHVTVCGIIYYFIKEEDNKGYIELVCTDKDHTRYAETLIKSALTSLKSDEVPSVQTHIVTNDRAYKDLHTKMGFKQLEQTGLEKTYNMIRFEYTF